jgi:NlpC/P60 family
MVRYLHKTALFGFCLSIIVCGAPTKSAAQQRVLNRPQFETGFLENPNQPAATTLNAKSLLLLMGTQITETELDCSHFVQYLYEQAGLYYGYTPSRVLYKGIKDFKRVLRPKSGDLVVWQGHVGIVVNPKEATFISALRSGVKTSSYTSDYWKRRGHPRFLRYIGQPQDAPALSAHKFTPYAGVQVSSSE